MIIFKLGLVSLFVDDISTFEGYLMPTLSLLKSSSGYYLNHSWEDKVGCSFPKGISPRLEFELAYNGIAVKQVSNYATGTTPIKLE